MHLLVLGATGRTGQRVVEQGLERGHTVTAVVRRSSIRKAEHLRIVVADPGSTEQLLPAMAEQDAVISCLGQRPGGDPWIVGNAAIATLAAMKKAAVKRYVIVSGALLYPSRNPLVLVLKRAMKDKLADAHRAEQAITTSDAHWTIVRPPHLREGDGKGYRTDAGTRPKLTWGLQFQDLANCLLDLAEEDAFVGQIVGVASR